MKAAQILRDRIHRQQLITGVLCTFHFWPGLVELVRRAGLDYLIIDFEHMTWDVERVAEACAIGRREDFPILIRPPQAELTPLRLAADLGPSGLLVPYVESAATLDLVRDAVWMRPRGRRRPGGHVMSWVKDVNYTTFRREVEDDLIILPQIESQAGLAAAADIARHPLTTALAVGPYDLSADLGVCWEPAHPRLLAAIEQIREAGRRAGKNMWMIGNGADLVQRGFSFLCIGEPIMALEGALRQQVTSLRQGQPQPAPEDRPLP